MYFYNSRNRTYFSLVRVDYLAVDIIMMATFILLSLFILQHLVFFALWLVKYLIPDIPSRIRRLMLREHFLAKEARYGFMFRNLGKESEVQANRYSSEDDVDGECGRTRSTPPVPV